MRATRLTGVKKLSNAIRLSMESPGPSKCKPWASPTAKLRMHRESIMDCVRHDPETHVGIWQEKLSEVKKSQQHIGVATPATTLTACQLQATPHCVSTPTAIQMGRGSWEPQVCSPSYQSSCKAQRSQLNKKSAWIPDLQTRRCFFSIHWLIFPLSSEAYLRDTAGSVPGLRNKSNSPIKRVTEIFWFPSTYKSYLYTIL